MNKFLFFLISFFLAFNAFSMPSAIILIRHAEKPTKGSEGQNLSKKGWKRAYALPKLFTDNLKLKRLGLPGILIAVKPHSKAGSVRSIQTLQPLSEWLLKPIHAEFTKDEINELVQVIKTSPEMNGQVVMIAWQHDSLSELANRLGAWQAPSEWPSETFDRFWLLDFENNKLVNFQNLPQQLLEKDSKK